MSDARKPQDEPKLSIDSDWKAQAQAEKQKLAEQAQQAAAASGGSGGPQGPGGPHEIPPADFKTLASTLVSQALLYMGAIPDPYTGQRIAHLDLAKHHIDLLGVLEEKTRGNLDEEEKQLVSQALSELRMYYLQVSQQLAAQMAKRPAAPGMSGPGSGPGMPGPGPGPAAPSSKPKPGPGGLIIP
jgi:hypothetical protein